MIFLRFILIFVIFTQTTFAGNHNLKLVVDEFHYKLSVEWDQKDQQEYQKIINDFKAQLQILINQGLDKNEIISFVEINTRNPLKLEHLKNKLEIMFQNEETDINDFLYETMLDSHLDFYHQGASWGGNVGEVIGYTILGIILAGALAYGIWHAVNFQCVAWDSCGEYRCRDDDGDYYTSSFSRIGDSCRCQSTCTNYERR